MRKIVFVLITSLCIFRTHPLVAQEQGGIRFIDQSMNKAIERAGAENKLIFIDCYTSWCSPCKWMADNIFTMDSVAAFYNDHFVNLKMDMEKGDGPKYREKYGVQVFPTYLFLNAKGRLVHKSASRMEASEFMDEARRALSPDRSSTVLEEKYRQGDRSLFTLLNYVEVLQKLNRDKADSVKQELIAGITAQELKTPLGWKAISELATDMDGALYTFMQKNEIFFRSRYGNEAVDKVTARCLQRKLYALSDDEHQQADFFNTLKQLRALPERENQVKAAQTELEYYIAHNDLKSFTRVSKHYAATLLKDDDMALSFLARRAEYADDKGFLVQACRLAEQAVAINPDEYANQGTLAEICYALGQKQEAIKAAKKAYELSLKDSSKIQKIALALLEKVEKM